MHDYFVHVEPSRPAAVLEQLHFVLDLVKSFHVLLPAAESVCVVPSENDLLNLVVGHATPWDEWCL